MLMVAMVILVGRHECLSRQEIRAYIATVQANRVRGVISGPEMTTTSDAGEATTSVAASLATEATFATTVQANRMQEKPQLLWLLLWRLRLPLQPPSRPTG